MRQPEFVKRIPTEAFVSTVVAWTALDWMVSDVGRALARGGEGDDSWIWDVRGHD